MVKLDISNHYTVQYSLIRQLQDGKASAQHVAGKFRTKKCKNKIKMSRRVLIG